MQFIFSHFFPSKASERHGYLKQQSIYRNSPTNGHTCYVEVPVCAWFRVSNDGKINKNKQFKAWRIALSTSGMVVIGRIIGKSAVSNKILKKGV